MTGILRRAADLGVLVSDGIVYVAPLPEGPIMVLTDAAAEVWLVADGAAPGSVAARLAARRGVTEAEAAPDADRYLRAFTDAGLLRA
ncbi:MULTISPECIES: PqqD family peptide modification chaperone [unclassified Microbacterium]|uniref:PqqD family peptide modification chaperone n=1 Tax=unclassified Microbacterium TaxID=2609290 RepID=UPI0012F779EB|nr:PqqD family peptide modification chaperone [Microbacterium sp. MAH-37]MVQ42622.1 hypothetical protein [Microbacterium sp. MAH-37]